MEWDAEVHMTGMVQGDVQVPAFRGVVLGKPGGEVPIVELQGGFAESKATAGLDKSAAAVKELVGVIGV